MGEFVVSPILMITADRSAMFTSTVVIAGISIVVGVLLLLILVFYLFGMIVSRAEKKAKSKSKKSSSPPVKETVKMYSAPAPVMPKAAPAPIVEQGISSEVVAAIAAAVAVSEGSQAVVRSIKKVNVGGRNPWASAAIAENTRPF